ncbi:UL6 [Vombatid gammaherpesvirus 1]|uniref:UL6 n=1 Tax=Vombatid gammaherpesvirus 1 TaxID=2052651 RepID=A0A3S8D7E0_9GAMA|nr:UL6 [Vombatid gammaherpesvirus 1]AZB49140.1 UL6 [Vombatid gammaherpesvirus 1]
MNPGSDPPITVHPTSLSRSLFDILTGKVSYVKGQTLYSSLRNPAVFTRQLFVHFYKTALAACNYATLVEDWKKYSSQMTAKWNRVAQAADSQSHTFESWAKTVRLAVDKLVLHNIYHAIHVRFSALYERYVDWMVTTGLIPVVVRPRDKNFIGLVTSRINALEAEASCKALSDILSVLKAEVEDVLGQLTSVYIPDSTEVLIQYDAGEFYATYRGKKYAVVVIRAPIIGVSGVMTFDGPLQRLHANIISCQRTIEHAKVCQLLHTAPLKAIVGDTNNLTYKDIMEHIEKNSQREDPKKEMFKLLVKLSENKTVSGVTDVVEDFVSDVSNVVIDKNKLFGNPDMGVVSGLKKRVNQSVLKCLSNQVNDQFETIRGLERERETYLKKISSMEEKISNYTVMEHAGGSDGTVELDVSKADTLQSINKMYGAGLHVAKVRVGKDDVVLNSFMSQYIPPYRETVRDLCDLWESEIIHSFRMEPVMDNQGQRLYVRYTQDTISNVLGPFIYIILKLESVELIPHDHSDLSLADIVDRLYGVSRLKVYIDDIGSKILFNDAHEESEKSNQQVLVGRGKSTLHTKTGFGGP